MMSHNRLVLLLTAFAAAAAAVVLQPTHEVQAVQLPTLPVDVDATKQRSPTADIAPLAVHAETTTPAPSPLASVEASDGEVGFGSIYGYLTMPVELFDEVTRYTIVVVEERNEAAAKSLGLPRAFNKQRGFRVDPSTTPRFAIHDVPFCQHPYRVKVVASGSDPAGYNGSSVLVRLDAGHPTVEEERCVLAISKGVPYAVRLRNQHFKPVTGTWVYMQPTGQQIGLSAQRGETDSFGSVLFESVLAGDYKLFVGDIHRPFIEPIAVRVQQFTPVGKARGIKPQGKVLEVPTGQPVRIEIFNRNRYGVEGVAVRAREVNTTRLFRPETVSDHAGIATFHHLPPGSYEVDIMHREYHRRTCMLEVREDSPPEPMQIEIRHR